MRPLPYEDPGRPDLRSPGRLMLWVAGGQWRSIALGCLWGTLWFVAQALLPAAIGQAIDAGVIHPHTGALVDWTGVILGLAAVAAFTGLMRHRCAVANWMQASFRIMQLVGTRVSKVGDAVRKRIPTGEVVATVASDAHHIGEIYDVTARFCGSIAAYVVVAVILLHISLPLGLLVLLGVPAVTALLGLLIRPLHRRQAAQRDAVGRLTTLGADTVSGLRVLRGIGGEEAFARRYREQSGRVRARGVEVASVQSVMDATQVLLPGAFVVAITWFGVHFALRGEITPGQLVAAYGYAAFLVGPLSTAVEMADRATRGYVAMRRVIRVLSVEPDVRDPAEVAPSPPEGVVELSDPTSGLVVHPGRLTAVVTAEPQDGLDLADRLGRFAPAGAEEGTPPARLGGVPVSQLPLAEVRRRIVVSENDPHLFTGPLRDQLVGAGAARSTPDAGSPIPSSTAPSIATAISAASATDAVDALPGGLDGQLEERGRSLSGGQRQRIALTRALLTDAEILVLVEPTSAVDAHTEARIGAGLRRARAGRSTVLLTTSPLLLEHADDVAYVESGGRVRATGTHAQLLADPAYRSVVLRGEDES